MADAIKLLVGQPCCARGQPVIKAGDLSIDLIKRLVTRGRVRLRLPEELQRRIVGAQLLLPAIVMADGPEGAVNNDDDEASAPRRRAPSRQVARGDPIHSDKLWKVGVISR